MPDILSRYEKNARLAALLLLIFACYQVLQSFVIDMLWAAILCFVTWPMYCRLREWQLGRNQAATCMVLPIALLILTPFVAATFTFSEDINQILSWLSENTQSWPQAPEWLKNLPLIGERAALGWQSLSQDSSRAIALARQYALTTSGWLLKQGVHLASQLMHMALSLLVLFFFYRDGEQVAQHTVLAAQRIIGPSSQRVLSVVRSSLRAVVYGILGTALVQALASIVGFMIADVPYAFVLGVCAFFLMLIPGAGMIVWIPVSAWLFSKGENGWALFIAAWFVLFVGTIDNWLRPILISREVELPFVLIVLGIFGGLLAFGFIGLFLGPTLLATGYSVLLEWLKQRKPLDSATAAE